MKQFYDHAEIEKKWRARWQELSLYSVDPTTADEGSAYYCLDMFPYPSGDGLHVGHWRGYVLSDVYARLARLKGKKVLHPMGFDAFGLPAENAAIKTKTHPKDYTDQAIANFTKQLQQLGASFDWSKTVNTSSPDYYRWTQWLFLQLYKHGHAEKRDGQVNWCPKDETVLANEQVVDGKCERCGTTVTKKNLSQWYFKTTSLAQELLDGLDQVNWPEHVKTLQRNWIGRSVGAELSFESPAGPIAVFTTRPDTLFGVTALVLAPEHPLVDKLVSPEQRDAVTAYLAEVRSKTNIDRQQQKETAKTAVFTGAAARVPLSEKDVPIWIADYVLMDYGTGAVMSVPAHDERDNQFARTHNLPVVPVIQSDRSTVETDPALVYEGDGVLIDAGEFSGRVASEVVSDIVAAANGKTVVTYRLRDWLVSRQRYWGAPIPIVYDPDGTAHAVNEEHLPLELPTDVDFLPGGESPLARSAEYKERAEKLYGKGWRFETDTLDTFVDSSWYFLRYLTPNDATKPFDKQLVKKRLPVDLYIGGIEHATLHLLYARYIARFLTKYGDDSSEPYLDPSVAEPFKQLFNIGMITLHGAKMSKSKGNVVSPDPLIEHYGTDALRGYELFVGPMDIEAEWSVNGINGIHRFLIKLVEEVRDSANTESNISEEDFDTYLRSIDSMYEGFRLNTVIAEAMKFLNKHTGHVSSEIMQKFAVTLYPIFPYISEEIYSLCGGNKDSVFFAPWPTPTTTVQQARVTVLVNQKFVGTVQVGEDAAEAEVLDVARDAGFVPNNVQRTIYKPGIALNLIAPQE